MYKGMCILHITETLVKEHSHSPSLISLSEIIPLRKLLIESYVILFKHILLTKYFSFAILNWVLREEDWT